MRDEIWANVEKVMEHLALPTSDLVTCVVVSWNGRELLRKCLSIFYQNTTNVKCGVVAVDNASNDGQVRMLNSDFPSVHVIRNDRNVRVSRLPIIRASATRLPEAQNMFCY